MIESKRASSYIGRGSEGEDGDEGSHEILRRRSSLALHLEIATNGSTKCLFSHFCSKVSVPSTLGRPATSFLKLRGGFKASTGYNLELN